MEWMYWKHGRSPFLWHNYFSRCRIFLALICSPIIDCNHQRKILFPLYGRHQWHHITWWSKCSMERKALNQTTQHGDMSAAKSFSVVRKVYLIWKFSVITLALVSFSLILLFPLCCFSQFCILSESQILCFYIVWSREFLVSFFKMPTIISKSDKGIKEQSQKCIKFYRGWIESYSWKLWVANMKRKTSALHSSHLHVFLK